MINEGYWIEENICYKEYNLIDLVINVDSNIYRMWFSRMNG